MTRHEPKTCRVSRDIELAYDEFGTRDAPVILLISGLGTQMIRWTGEFCAALAEQGYRIIRFDNRDAGLSTHLNDMPPPDFTALVGDIMAGRMPAVPYGLGDMAADAIGLMDALSIDRAHVVGRSMGGMIAQIMACDAPDRILSLTSIMSSTGNPSLPQAEPDVMAMMAQPKPDPENFICSSLAFARRIAGDTQHFDEAAHRALLVAELQRSHDPAGAARQLAAMATAGDRRSNLAKLQLPALVIHGSKDPLIPPASGKDTAAAIPGAELLTLEGMGHDLPPEFFAPVIDAIHRTARSATGRSNDR